MRRKFFVLSALGTMIALAACLTAPDEPDGTSRDALSCGEGSRAFNGACRATCTKSADCPSGLKCTNVGDGAVCIAYAHCANLGSDRTCTLVGGGAYGYSSPPSYGSSSPPSVYGYGRPGCAGDALWEIAPASGDPQCGAAHSVTRCQRQADRCVLVAETSIDVGEP